VTNAAERIPSTESNPLVRRIERVGGRAPKADPKELSTSPTHWRASAAATALAILSLMLADCGAASTPTANGTTAAPAGDFNIVAYQGDAVLGGKQVAFSKVFDQGKPVVLNFWAGLSAVPRGGARVPEGLPGHAG
jgi:hypothetical protein